MRSTAEEMEETAAFAGMTCREHWIGGGAGGSAVSLSPFTPGSSFPFEVRLSLLALLHDASLLARAVCTTEENAAPLSG
jgi:hypothetical protein